MYVRRLSPLLCAQELKGLLTDRLHTEQIQVLSVRQVRIVWGVYHDEYEAPEYCKWKNKIDSFWQRMIHGWKETCVDKEQSVVSSAVAQGLSFELSTKRTRFRIMRCSVGTFFRSTLLQFTQLHEWQPGCRQWWILVQATFRALVASQWSWNDVWMNRPCEEAKWKVPWAVLRTGCYILVTIRPQCNTRQRESRHATFLGW